VKIDNSQVVREVDPRASRDLWWLLVLVMTLVGGLGAVFGPVMVLWFAVLAVLGLQHVVQNPAILWALSPHYALAFLRDEREGACDLEHARGICSEQ